MLALKIVLCACHGDIEEGEGFVPAPRSHARPFAERIVERIRWFRPARERRPDRSCFRRIDRAALFFRLIFANHWGEVACWPRAGSLVAAQSFHLRFFSTCSAISRWCWSAGKVLPAQSFSLGSSPPLE